MARGLEDEGRKLRILAMAVQHHGADPTEAKNVLDDPNWGMDPKVSDRTHAQSIAMAANLKGGRAGHEEPWLEYDETGAPVDPQGYASRLKSWQDNPRLDLHNDRRQEGRRQGPVNG